MMHEPAAEILAKRSWGDFHLFRFRTAEGAADARPGQFLMIRTNDGHNPLLRRPISLHDAGDGWREIFFKVAGEGTALLARKREGETLDVLGPCGRGFDLSGDWNRKTAVLVGGGRGIAPLFFLGRELRRIGAGVEILYGGRTLAELPLLDKFAAAGFTVLPATDDGSFGSAGFVTDLLAERTRTRRPEGVFVCGPDPMMHRCAILADGLGLPAQISLESIMGCGFGACWGCVKRIRRNGEAGWRKICEDGPVFAAEDIVWDES